LPKEAIGLMYSGGVDSIICLKLLVEQNIIPILFHVKTAKMNQRHERCAKRNAKRLSPKSPYYTVKTHTLDYNASWTVKQSYFIYLDEWASMESCFCPMKYVDKLAIGYFRSIGGKRAKGETGLGQPELIKWVETYNPPIILPLKDKTGKEIDKMFAQLPLEIQKDTISSTRFYKHNGQTVGKALCTHGFIGDYT
jgi:hypothetical protein